MMLYWRETLLLWLMMLPLVVAVILTIRERQRQANMVDVELIPWIQPVKRRRHEWLTQLLLSLLWALLILALAGPRTPQHIPNDLSSTKDRVVIVLDYSDSMRARDELSPQGVVTRMTAANQLASSWFDHEDQMVESGLLAFSGRAHWLLKPTTDANLIHHFLSQADEFLLPTLGSNLADALSAIQSLPKKPDTKTHIVLLTDGDFAPEKTERLESALLALQASMPITLNLIGLGSGEPASVPTNPSATTQMNSSLLKSLASLNRDFHYRTPNQLLDLPLMEWLNIQSKRITPENYARVLWLEWFWVPLLLALLMMPLLIRRSTLGRSDD